MLIKMLKCLRQRETGVIDSCFLRARTGPSGLRGDCLMISALMRQLDRVISSDISRRRNTGAAAESFLGNRLWLLGGRAGSSFYNVIGCCQVGNKEEPVGTLNLGQIRVTWIYMFAETR